MKKKILTGIIASIIALMPLVLADAIGGGPILIIIPIIGLIILAGCIVGAVFLIRWIIRRVKHEK